MTLPPGENRLGRLLDQNRPGNGDFQAKYAVADSTQTVSQTANQANETAADSTPLPSAIAAIQQRPALLIAAGVAVGVLAGWLIKRR